MFAIARDLKGGAWQQGQKKYGFQVYQRCLIVISNATSTIEYFERRGQRWRSERAMMQVGIEVSFKNSDGFCSQSLIQYKTDPGIKDRKQNKKFINVVVTKGGHRKTFRDEVIGYYWSNDWDATLFGGDVLYH